MVALPEHFHCLLTLPPDDANFLVSLKLIKIHVTRYDGAALKINRAISKSRQKWGESNLWQRRYWEHWVRDELDFATHCDYVHYNPVRYGLCKSPQDWPRTSVCCRGTVSFSLVPGSEPGNTSWCLGQITGGGGLGEKRCVSHASYRATGLSPLQSTSAIAIPYAHSEWKWQHKN